MQKFEIRISEKLEKIFIKIDHIDDDADDSVDDVDADDSVSMTASFAILQHF